jgi:hypothetical protein
VLLLDATAVLMACAAAVLAASKKAEATFPGKNGRMAYASDLDTIYTMHPTGGNKVRVTEDGMNATEPSY